MKTPLHMSHPYHNDGHSDANIDITYEIVEDSSIYVDEISSSGAMAFHIRSKPGTVRK